MFRLFPHKPASKAEVAAPHDGVVIGSKRIMEVQRTSMEIDVPLFANEDTKAKALAELKAFAIANHVTDAVFREFVDGDRIVFAYDCGSSETGKDYNSLIYSNIVWVEDLVN